MLSLYIWCPHYSNFLDPSMFVCVYNMDTHDQVSHNQTLSHHLSHILLHTPNKKNLIS